MPVPKVLAKAPGGPCAQRLLVRGGSPEAPLSVCRAYAAGVCQPDHSNVVASAFRLRFPEHAITPGGSMAEATASPGAASGAAEQPSLRRVMGPGLLLLFVVGNILGTGIYALTGQVAARVGGAVWMPFVVAFLVAIITAFSYLELVTKYPRAAGAALYTHKAFGVHFLTFIVAFTVMCSGITSASTASRVFASNVGESFDLDLGDGIKITLVALAFIPGSDCELPGRW
jgi:hypothetical protein